MTTEEIVALLQKAKEAYYDSTEPIMSDTRFDQLEDQLRTVDPENPYFSKVGTITKGKITHKIPMLSMQKSKSIPELIKWVEKLSLPDGTALCIQPKIDGLSATCCYENGRLSYIATRGDGTTGQDISHIAPFVSSIMDSISFSTGLIEVRGELYLPKNTSFDTRGKPLRNNCVGLINRKENYEDVKHVAFAAFQIAGASDHSLESDVETILSNEGFNPVPMHTVIVPDEIEAYYSRYLETLREEWLFETDGLVVIVNDRTLFEEIDSRWVVDHHHHYAMALKPPSEARQSILRDVIWQVSRQGNVIPVALFEPVHIGGAKIERASLSNYETVKRMRITIGDALLIERANDVIPYIRENISATRREEASHVSISECPSCGTKLIEEGVHLNCPNPDCPETNIQKILYWIRQSGIEQIAEATVRTLYNKGMARSIKELYHLRHEDFENVEGFAEKKTTSFIEEMERSRSMSARDFISKLGIPLVQKKALDRLGINSIDGFLNFEDTTYVAGQNIVQWKASEKNMSMFNELCSILEISDENQVMKKGSVCMTGKGPKGRNELINDIEAMGYEFVSTVTKETDILLTNDPSGKSSKLQKAAKNGTKIMAYSDFFNF